MTMQSSSNPWLKILVPGIAWRDTTEEDRVSIERHWEKQRTYLPPDQSKFWDKIFISIQVDGRIVPLQLYLKLAGEWLMLFRSESGMCMISFKERHQSLEGNPGVLEETVTPTIVN